MSILLNELEMERTLRILYFKAIALTWKAEGKGRHVFIR